MSWLFFFSSLASPQPTLPPRTVTGPQTRDGPGVRAIDTMSFSELADNLEKMEVCTRGALSPLARGMPLVRPSLTFWRLLFLTDARAAGGNFALSQAAACPDLRPRPLFYPPPRPLDFVPPVGRYGAPCTVHRSVFVSLAILGYDPASPSDLAPLLRPLHRRRLGQGARDARNTGAPGGPRVLCHLPRRTCDRFKCPRAAPPVLTLARAAFCRRRRRWWTTS